MRVGQFTLKTFFQYMENLARSNQSLLHTDANRHFVRSNFSELVGKAFEDLHSPAMLVDTYEAEGIDHKSDNLLVKRYVAFTIIKRITEKGNHAQLLDLETDCETIAMKVLARMKYDRRSATTNMRAKQQLFADVDLNAWEGHVLNEMLNGAWAAYRIQVPIINADDRLTMNAADWDDTNEQPIFYDISGLSCANLNDPSQGLTDEQRLNCLAVTIYESDGTTVHELVPAGGEFTLPTQTEVAAILTYPDQVTAEADTTTIPTTAQLVRVLTTNKYYAGDGSSAVADVVRQDEFLKPSAVEMTADANYLYATDPNGTSKTPRNY